VMSDRYFIASKGRINVDISAQTLMDCSNGCKGGTANDAFKAMTAPKKAPPAWCAPYSGKSGTCAKDHHQCSGATEYSIVPEGEKKIRDMLASKTLVMGFGHRIYKNGDPRNAIFKKMSKLLSERPGGKAVLWQVSDHIENLMANEKKMFDNQWGIDSADLKIKQNDLEVAEFMLGVTQCKGDWPGKLLQISAGSKLGGKTETNMFASRVCNGKFEFNDPRLQNSTKHLSGLADAM